MAPPPSRTSHSRARLGTVARGAHGLGTHPQKSKKRARGRGSALLTRLGCIARSPVRLTGRGFLLHAICFYLTAPSALSKAPIFRFSGFCLGSVSLAFCCFCIAAKRRVLTSPMSLRPHNHFLKMSFMPSWSSGDIGTSSSDFIMCGVPSL